jgi:hypothetical protein
MKNLLSIRRQEAAERCAEQEIAAALPAASDAVS